MIDILANTFETPTKSATKRCFFSNLSRLLPLRCYAYRFPLTLSFTSRIIVAQILPFVSCVEAPYCQLRSSPFLRLQPLVKEYSAKIRSNSLFFNATYLYQTSTSSSKLSAFGDVNPSDRARPLASRTPSHVSLAAALIALHMILLPWAS